MYRQARALRIADGVDEVHKTTIARAMLKNAEPSDGPWPSEWVPGRREAAIRKFSHLIDLYTDNL